MKKLSKTSRRNFITYGVVIAAYLLMQLLISTGNVSSLIKGQLIPICVYASAAVSLNLCVGILGELSLGHAGFMSIGCYAGAVAAAALEGAIPNPIARLVLAMIVGAAVAAIGGIIIGVPVLKLNGDYLAIVTLAFGEIIRAIMTNIYVSMDATGIHFSLIERIKAGDGGRMIINGAIGLQVPTKLATFGVGICLLLFTLFVVFNLTNSKTGRAIRALRDNKIAAESVGISISKYKLMGFVISAALAGAAGTLFGQNFGTMEAAKFDFNLSILILVFVVLGGLGNLRGSVIAAVLLTLLPELLRAFSNYRMLTYAVVLILVMLATNNASVRGWLDRAADVARKAIAPLYNKLLKKKGDAENA